jgi:hypothetical protein
MVHLRLFLLGQHCCSRGGALCCRGPSKLCRREERHGQEQGHTHRWAVLVLVCVHAAGWAVHQGFVLVVAVHISEQTEFAARSAVLAAARACLLLRTPGSLQA